MRQMLSMHLGPTNVILAMKVAFDRGLGVGDLERTIDALEDAIRAAMPHMRYIFVEPDGRLWLGTEGEGIKMIDETGVHTIGLREDPDQVAKKLKTMQTDPARVRRTDPGDPEKCPVWDLHKLYSSPETQAWANQGCRTAGIGRHRRRCHQHLRPEEDGGHHREGL